MKLYKDGSEIKIDKSQLHLLLEAGWSLTNDPKEDIEEISASEEIISEEIVEEKITPPKKTLPKKVTPRKKVAPKIKPIKITKKE